jgi:phosphatidate phosphatase APP1
LAGTVSFTGATSACISNDGKEIIVKTYPALYYYSRVPGQSIEQALQNQYTPLPYVLEPQGEAVTFATDNSGYFTLSEKNAFSFLNLYFYRRK